MSVIGSTNEILFPRRLKLEVYFENISFFKLSQNRILNRLKEIVLGSQILDICTRYHGLLPDNCDKLVTKRSSLTIIDMMSICVTFAIMVK